MNDISNYEEHAISIVKSRDPASIDTTFINLWLHEKSPLTQSAYRAEMTRFHEFVGKPLREVTLQDVYTFKDSLATLKTTSRNRAIAAVKSALSFGVKSGYLQVNVGLMVKLDKPENKLAERILSEEEISRMLALENDKRNWLILALLYRAGLRCAELCSLTWRNLQPRENTGQISIYGKGDKTRFILLEPGTWQKLLALNAQRVVSLDEYVFLSRQVHFERTGKNDRRMDESTVFLIVQAAAARAGISEKKVSPHWFRHAHASHALKNGASIALVKETLGHASIETTSKYLHVMPNESSSTYLKV